MRMTRAALRAQASQESLILHEDEDANQELAKSQFNDARPALKDITEENTFTPEPLAQEHTTNKEAYGNDEASLAKQIDLEDEADEMITVEDAAAPEQPHVDTTTLDSPASEIASDSAVPMEVSEEGLDIVSETTSPSTPLVSDTKSESLPEDQHAPEITEEPYHDQPATSKTPKFIPEIHSTAIAMSTTDDSFVDSIKSRTPGKPSAECSKHEEDSFVHKIVSRTPRPSSLIADPVEAMDMLEDAIEQFSGELPILGDLRIESPTKERVATPRVTPGSSRKAAVSPASLKTVSPAGRSLSKSPSRVASKTVSKPPTASAGKQTATLRAPNARPTSTKPALKSSVGSKPTSQITAQATKSLSRPTRPSTAATKSTSNAPANAVKKRVPSDALSTSRPGFVPAKSTKPATKSTFTLPGEAYAAKMKAQREEKLRKEEEESAAKRKFKARPAPSAGSRPSVLPRENKASQARLSRVFSGNDKENVEPKPVTSKRPVSMMLDHKKVRTEPNSSIRRAASVTSKSSSSSSREPKFAANVPRVASLTSRPAAPKIEATPTVQKKVNGKEVFGRSKMELKKQEDEKREKEEAARKARAEAAERGRQASREWAEKQKVKQAALKAAKTNVQDAGVVT